VGESRSSFPSNLAGVPTELDRLYQELGGPAPLSVTIDPHAFRRPCEVFCFERVWPAFNYWVTDESVGRRYWPWIAFVASQYRFERREKEKYVDEPKPSEFANLLKKIGRSSEALVHDLGKLRELASRLDDSEAPLRRAHMEWAQEYLSQSLLAGPQEVNEHPLVSMQAHGAWRHLIRKLVWLSVAAKSVKKRVRPQLLTRPRMQGDRGLGNLVERAALIWAAMTDRPASVNKVTSGPPDFVTFVGNVAEMSCGHRPTFDEIDTAFRHTPNRAEKKSPSPV
jgi:hypothetical protein